MIKCVTGGSSAPSLDARNIVGGAETHCHRPTVRPDPPGAESRSATERIRYGADTRNERSIRSPPAVIEA
jgi:hypothetical protein